MTQHVRDRRRTVVLGAALLAGALVAAAFAQDAFVETAARRDARMAWWREARFGLFIHWGLYAIPAGTWEGRPVGGVGEWIQHIGRIPVAEYEPLRERFDPVAFDADAWARIAADAGMRYVVITTKHHDGFALFHSDLTDWDVASTPFGRDVMAELAAACRRRGLRIGWYHSILDWHHPDYLPRRDWHRRPADEADYDRYRAYLRGQVTELLTRYGDIDVMWFDGEWDATWTHADGLAMDVYVRSLQPDVIVNNRVDKSRWGDREVAGPPPETFAGDFGTPEQEIPATGRPGVDWETCMTMNDTWGYKADDERWKTRTDLLRKLADIASKGGNFLLNVGPTAQGRIPAASVARLRAMGQWMRINGESIYGTSASPFAHLPWGRCTQRAVGAEVTRLYLHVFDWPEDGTLRLPGLANTPRGGATLLADSMRRSLPTTRHEDALWIEVPARPPDAANSVVVLDIDGRPDVCDPPTIDVPHETFVDRVTVGIAASGAGSIARYTTDGTAPTAASPAAGPPLTLTGSCPLAVRAFRDGRPVSGTRTVDLRRVEPRPPVVVPRPRPGLDYAYYEGDCNVVADLLAMTPAATGIVADLDLTGREVDEHFGFIFRGFVRLPVDGLYTFGLSADDGATLAVGGDLVVDHDGIHAASEKRGHAALGAGLHPIEVRFFEKGGDEVLDLFVEGPDLPRRRVDAGMLFHGRPETRSE